MTAEELIVKVREAMEKAGEEGAVKGGAATVAALEQYLNQRFAARPGAAYKSPGQQLAEDPQTKEFIAARMKNTAPIGIKVPGYGLKSGEYIPPRFKATIDTTYFPQERTMLPVAEFPQRSAQLRDVIPVAGLGTPMIEYARVTGYTNSAGGVAEGGVKPESAIATLNVEDSVKTLATFIPVTRQVLRDVPGLQAYVNQVLGYFLRLVEDNQILNGSGGSNMTGIRQTAGIQTQTFSVNQIETFRKGITKLQTAFTDAGFDPSAAVLHPADWEVIELTKDLQDRYILLPVGPQDTAAARLWRVPVVVTPAQAQGVGLLGAFDIGCTLWTYDDLTIRMTDSHEDWFKKNLIAILAEFRELLAVYFPGAFVELDLTA